LFPLARKSISLIVFLLNRSSVIALLYNCASYELHSNFIDYKKEQSCPFVETGDSYLCSRSWLMLRQALIKKISKNPIKDRIYPNSLKIWKIRYQSTSTFLSNIISLQNVKRKIKTGLFWDVNNFKIWNSSLWKLSKIAGRTESYPF